MKAVALGLLAAGALVSAANAAVIYNSNGFEAPGYVAGNLGGQNGWISDPAAHTAHNVVAGTVGTVAPLGGQMVQATLTSAGARFSFADITAGVAARPLGEDFIWCQYDYNNPTGTTSTAFTGVAAYDATAAIIAAVWVRPSDGLLIGTFDPDGAGTSFAFGSFSLGLTAPKNTWINLGLAVNVLTGAVAITSGNTVLFNGTGNTGFATLADFDIQTNASAVANSVFYDNFVINSASVVPAPSAAALLGLAGVMTRRRRR